MFEEELMRMIWDCPETPSRRRCRQLGKYIQSKLDCKRLSVCRSHIGNRTFYNIDMDSKTATSIDLDELFEDVSSGLIYCTNCDVKHTVYLVDEEELHEIYLNADGDLVFEEPFNFIDAFCKNDENKIKEQSNKIISVFCDKISDLCLIYINKLASPTDVLRDLKVKVNSKYWSHHHNVLVINMEYVDLVE